MQRLSRVIALVPILLIALAFPPLMLGAPLADDIAASAIDPSFEQLVKDRGLGRMGFLLVLPGEAEIHSGVRQLREAKVKVAGETLRHADLERLIKKNEQELYDLESQLAKANQHLKQHPHDNHWIGTTNALLAQGKQLAMRIDSLKEQDTAAWAWRSSYITIAMDLAKKLTPIEAKYDVLAKDAQLLAAIRKYNQSPEAKIKLGPSGNFLEDAALIKACNQELVTQVIPVKFAGGVPVVAVTINGVTRDMVWDSGAASVYLSAQTAAEFGLKTSERDRTTVSVLADGRQVENRLIVIPSIRVGAFTADDVECVVEKKSDVRGMDLLGGTFQRHFLCQLDLRASQLHLTRLDPAPPDAALGPAAPSTTQPSITQLPAPPPVASPIPAPTTRPSIVQAPPPAALPPASQPPPVSNNPAALQSGLLARYFSGSHEKELILTRVDRNIDFKWPQGDHPVPGITVPRYSVHWTGQLVIPPGNATAIGIDADDGAILTIDGVEEFHFSHPQRRFAHGNFTAGPHRIEVAYSNVLAQGHCNLLWVLGSDPSAEQIVPPSALFHSPQN